MFPKTDESISELNDYQESGKLAADLQAEFENIGLNCPLEVDVLSTEQLEEEVAEIVEEAMDAFVLSEMKETGEHSEECTQTQETGEESTQTYEELRDTWRDALLRITAWTGDEDKVKTLLQAGVQVNTENSEGETPLWDAMRGGHSSIVKLLLQKGADPGAGANTDSANTESGMGKSVLQLAAQSGNAEMVSILTEADADLNRTNSRGTTALFLAAEQGHAETMRTLIQAGADLNKADKEGTTPLSVAAEKGHAEVVSILVQAGADLNKVDDMGMTPLWFAADRGHAEIVSILTQAGADLNKTDLDKKTPLWIAAFYGNMEVVKVLIEAGADISIPDKSSKTPYQAAVETKHSDVAKMFPKTDESIRELNRDQESGKLAADVKKGFENIGLNCPLEVKILTMEELEEEVSEIVEETMDVFVLSEMQETGEDSEESTQTYEELRDDWRDENEKSAKPTDTVRKVKSSARRGVRRLEFALNAVQSRKLAKEMRMRFSYLKIEDSVKEELVSGAQQLEQKAMEDLSEFYNANKDLSRAAIIKVFKRHKVLRKGLKIAKMWPTSETDECVKALDSGQVTYRLTEYEKIGYHGPSQGDVRSMEQLEEDVLSETCEQTTQTDKVLGEGHKTDTDVPEDNETSTQTYEELRDAWRDALLRITAWTGDEDKVKTLLQAGVQVNTENSEGETPFCDAVTGGHSNIVKLLLQKGADPGAGENTARSRERASGMGKTLLHLAAEIGSVEWLSHLPITVVNKDETDRMGRTPLSVAAERGHAEVVSFLLYAWADVYKEDGDGRTPMWWAAWSGHAEVLRILRRQGFADMHMADCMGRTPLWVAAEKGHVDVVEFLVEEDGRPGIADLEQKTPLWIAAHNGNMEVVKVLIEAMAAEGSGLERDISKPDKTGKTPYQAAVERKHSDVAKVIEDQVTKTLQKKS
ncbi:PREDICTED: ankyrin repeat domain-containing protein 50-like [Branchiostoma belcheri]|uniref:Ankyrin repeat domain-containing protein 50-like n=1 Tax=Branchiostoma belcheri TaxID=7741 RepID=A0A6P4YCZ7_BRABE|nr:PREDICTED: ankyrin repeat domain-containing protein 50-like [Branchiostoma belcheri]